MPGKKKMAPRYQPKSKGTCAYSKCGKEIYKSSVRYKNQLWHAQCLVAAVREGEV